MTLVEEPPISETGGDSAPEDPDSPGAPGDDATVDSPRADDDATIDLDAETRPHGGPRIDPSGRIAYRGMRIRRVRLKSVAKLSFVFWLLAFAVIIGTVVTLWNVARALGLVESFEETMVTSLGLETFEIDGSGIFGVVLGGTAILCVLGWLGTIAMAAVYNAACGVLGGLAVETGPLQRRRRVFSWRHRGFVTVSE
jgi:hypothetical protein